MKLIEPSTFDSVQTLLSPFMSMQPVMAAAESISETVTDESRTIRLQWLRQRREVLELKLSQKNNELKAVCIEEAEITGIIPPEIPLDPGESAPVIIKKKTSTNKNHNQNLKSKLKTTGTVSNLILLKLLL